MTDTEEKLIPPTQENTVDEDIQPSWKPLWWVLGILFAVLGLGEFIIEFGMEALELVFDIFENIYLVLVEAPEEILEDYIEEWLKQHFPNDASLYSEMVTAIGLTPVKILVGFVLLRGLWRYSKTHFLPKLLLWLKRHYLSVRLAIRLLAWPYKIIAAVVLLGILAVII